MSSMASAELIYLGMDTSMNTIVVGVLDPREEMPVVERVFNDEESIRPARLYRAGQLHREGESYRRLSPPRSTPRDCGPGGRNPGRR